MFRTSFLPILMMDRKTCPKHVEFYSQNKFEKSVHLVGFIIRIYHDARLSECQNHPPFVLNSFFPYPIRGECRGYFPKIFNFGSKLKRVVSCFGSFTPRAESPVSISLLKHDKHCRCNITLRRGRAAIVAVDKQ